MKEFTAYRVDTQDLRPGMWLYAWTRQSRERRGRYAGLSSGPDGAWNAMVVSNVRLKETRVTRGMGPMHLLHVMFWNESDSRLTTLTWGHTTHTLVIDL